MAPPPPDVNVVSRASDSRKEIYQGDDLGGAARMPPSSSAWAVKWRPPSAPPRKKPAPMNSPGPIYYPKDTWFGPGPNGTGAEYSLKGSHRFPLSDKKTRTDKQPGPKYTLTDGFGRQVESMKASQQSGKFGAYDRKTQSWLEADSPGPAHYDPPRPITAPKEKPNGFGSGLRTYIGHADYRPGPGDYKLPKSIGGYHPNKPSAPMASFGRGDRSGTKHMPVHGRDSPGPIYGNRASVGEQVQSDRKSSPKAPFSKANRFPPGYK